MTLSIIGTDVFTADQMPGNSSWHWLSYFHPLFIHHRTLEGSGIAPFMPTA